MVALLSYILGLFVGMLTAGMLLKSRLFYHINTFNINKIFKCEKQKKLNWMI
jgi:hypothetical protein